jgi:hypothetical protein
LKALAHLALILAFSIICLPLAAASPALVANLQTSKSWYGIGEDINVYGSILSNGTPLSAATVALEIHDPLGSPIITRSLQTNTSGIYSLIFKLQQDAQTGKYSVYASCAYNAETALNSTSFQASALALTITTGKESYDIGENVTVRGTATLNNVKLPQALIAVEVQNPNATPIIVRVLETDNQGTYNFTFQAPAGSTYGVYRAFASASHNGSIATAETSFSLRRQTNPVDINGDGVVNIVDIALVAGAWGTVPGNPRWDPRCDIDGNNAINIIDITMVARAYTR